MLLKKFLVVLAGVILFRIGSFIPIPGVDAVLVGQFFNNSNGTILDFVNAFGGGSLERMSIFSTGIMPYISASIILYVATFFSPHIKSLQQEGMKGQTKIAQYTRWLTLGIVTFQAFMLTSALSTQVVGESRIIPNAGFDFYITAILALVAGTMTLIWIGEKITEYGIGNGISLIIYAGIVSGLPQAIGQTVNLIDNGEIDKLTVIVVSVAVLAAIVFVVYVEKARREVPVEHSQKSFEHLHSHKGKLPFKLNSAGIMPPIFAAMILTLPATLNAFAESMDFQFLTNITYYFQHGTVFYMMFYAVMIIVFSHFLVKSKNNPKDLSDKLKGQGAFIRGLRPGKPTENYLSSVINRLSAIGAGYLVIVCLLPEFLISYFSVPFYFGGTSLLIIVSVALDWQKQVGSHFKGKEYKDIGKGLLDDFKGRKA